MSAVAVDNVILFRACEALPVIAREPPPLSPSDRARIEHLRVLARESLLCSRADLDNACAMIAIERTATVRRYALALFGILSDHASARLQFYPPGTQVFSDGEIWLSRALRAFAREDTPSGRALIVWRVKPIAHRRARYLISGLADAFQALEGDSDLVEGGCLSV